MKTQQAKDSAFTLLFKQEKYAAQLYELLTGKKINASTIRSVQLQDGLVKPRLYNDVSFLTEDNELLVLIEHQTTLNKTMAFRLLEYYVKLTGKFKGAHEKAVEMAKSLLGSGMSREDISKHSGLSMDTIRGIA